MTSGEVAAAPGDAGADSPAQNQILEILRGILEITDGVQPHRA